MNITVSDESAVELWEREGGRKEEGKEKHSSHACTGKCKMYIHSMCVNW